jgi:L-rhamnose mutarotase
MVVLKHNVKGVDKEKIIKFGEAGAEDYTIHKDDERKKLYISRHEKNENWTKTGIATAGFWSRWLLWNKKTINASLNDIKKTFF